MECEGSESEMPPQQHCAESAPPPAAEDGGGVALAGSDGFLLIDSVPQVAVSDDGFKFPTHIAVKAAQLCTQKVADGIVLCLTQASTSKLVTGVAQCAALSSTVHAQATGRLLLCIPVIGPACAEQLFSGLGTAELESISKSTLVATVGTIGVRGQVLGIASHLLAQQAGDLIWMVSGKGGTATELLRLSASRVVRAAGCLGGGAAGTAVGTLVMPGVGTCVGTFVGSLIGGVLVDDMTRQDGADTPPQQRGTVALLADIGMQGVLGITGACFTFAAHSVAAVGGRAAGTAVAAVLHPAVCGGAGTAGSMAGAVLVNCLIDPADAEAAPGQDGFIDVVVTEDDGKGGTTQRTISVKYHELDDAALQEILASQKAAHAGEGLAQTTQSGGTGCGATAECGGYGSSSDDGFLLVDMDSEDSD